MSQSMVGPGGDSRGTPGAPSPSPTPTSRRSPDSRPCSRFPPGRIPGSRRRRRRRPRLRTGRSGTRTTGSRTGSTATGSGSIGAGGPSGRVVRGASATSSGTENTSQASQTTPAITTVARPAARVPRPTIPAVVANTVRVWVAETAVSPARGEIGAGRATGAKDRVEVAIPARFGCLAHAALSGERAVPAAEILDEHALAHGPHRRMAGGDAAIVDDEIVRGRAPHLRRSR